MEKCLLRYKRKFNASSLQPLLILVCNEDVHHMRLQRIINIPLLMNVHF